jgi:hypothetical protein
MMKIIFDSQKLVSMSKYIIYFVLSSKDGGTNGIQLWVPTIGGRPL